MKYLLPIIILATLGSCDSGVEWSSPPYQVYWIDTRSELELGYRQGDSWHARVLPRVVAVARNDNFVTAIREHGDQRKFYYIEIAKDDFLLNANEITQGPFSAADFEELKSTLDLPDPEPL